MPAMPKEKATAVSLTENNFSELKYKELATSAAVVAATAATAAAAAAIATTATVPATTTTMAATTGQRHQQNSSSTHHHHIHHHPQQQRNLCGCGNASASPTAEVNMRNKFMTNGKLSGKIF